jgi:catechol 2,3-dioxygenase-like lactoylglutathione lyase family enzyme
MFRNGNVTICVREMDRAVRFYTGALGLKPSYRFGDHWASVEVGRGLRIGLHLAELNWGQVIPGGEGSYQHE